MWGFFSTAQMSGLFNTVWVSGRTAGSCDSCLLNYAEKQAEDKYN